MTPQLELIMTKGQAYGRRNGGRHAYRSGRLRKPAMEANGMKAAAGFMFEGMVFAVPEGNQSAKVVVGLLWKACCSSCPCTRISAPASGGSLSFYRRVAQHCVVLWF